MTSRERLLDAARACLLERGHQASSVKAIAARAGVNHGLVHHYFGSKERLWVAVIEREAQHLRASLEAAPAAFMEGFYLPELLRHPDRVRLAIECLALSKSAPGIGAALREHFQLNREALARRFGLGTEAPATLLFAALFGLVIHAGLDPALPVEQAARLLLDLLAPPATRGTGSAVRGGAVRGSVVRSTAVRSPVSASRGVRAARRTSR
jgi:AcrR family transcriptional regulator